MRMVRRMRVPLSAAFIALAVLSAHPAVAQKPPSSVAQTPPAAGTLPSGKPPPLGVPWEGAPTLPGGDPDDVPFDQAYGSGTGFVVADRRLLTNRHVVVGCARVVARDAAGTRLPAKLVVADRGRDLALLSIEKPAGPPLTFRDSPAVRRGESVIAYGFPLSGLLSSGPTLTTGNVNALAGLRDNPNNYQISAGVQPGNSGGPLFDAQGHVIGVVVSKLDAARVAEMTGGDIPQNVNFAVKGEQALAFLRANNVQPAVAASTGPDKRADEIDAVANPSTVYLTCFR